ncbi:MAG: 2-C-methyl-D-erythritol 2,4-cyclodiphosphate synthase [Dehalococcoidales bacterium]|nr:2-C-methyl-D-erythritol 2,4-cyclodiphosphate synthase [Dehalococcoidales bacterium]
MNESNEGLSEMVIPGVRVGIGYDVHRLVEGRKLFLGGVEIPYSLGLLGFSDADVVLHAIMDAMLGAAALGDIGQHFPPGDARFKDISSVLLLERVNEMILQRRFRLGNVDVTVVAEQPKLLPHIPAIRKRIADTVKLDIDCVSVKGKTTEGLGFAGRGEGIAAYAVVALETF